MLIFAYLKGLAMRLSLSRDNSIELIDFAHAQERGERSTAPTTLSTGRAGTPLNLSGMSTHGDLNGNMVC
jgi:hypothetical protein